jgi:uncharacterized protein (TIGR00251 family)
MPVIQVRVRPNAGRSLLERLPDGTYAAKLKAAPVDGKANEELIALIAKQFACAKSSVILKTGATGRTKLVVVPDPQGPCR